MGGAAGVGDGLGVGVGEGVETALSPTNQIEKGSIISPSESLWCIRMPSKCDCGCEGLAEHVLRHERTSRIDYEGCRTSNVVPYSASLLKNVKIGPWVQTVARASDEVWRALPEPGWDATRMVYSCTDMENSEAERCVRDRCSLGTGGGLLGTVRLEPLVIAPDVQG